MKPWACAAFAAASISASEASGRASVMFSRTVPVLSQVSCKTMPKFCRRLSRVTLRTSCPSTVIAPPFTS